MRIKLFICYLGLSIFKFGYAQLNDNSKVKIEFQPLKIGDKVPDITIDNILNYPTTRAKISEFKGQLLILDFWNIGCVPCIAGFPKLEKIEAEFKDKVQIYLVNTINSKENLQKVGFPKSSKSQILNGTKLPFIIGSQELQEMFPHLEEPYHVWLDSNKTIIALTEGHNATIANIRNYLETGKIEFEMRPPVGFEYEKSILHEGGGRQISTIKSYSIIAGHVNGINHQISSAINDSLALGLRYFNQSILQLFQAAFKIEWAEVRLNDLRKYLIPRSSDSLDKWYQSNMYSYEIKMLVKSVDELFFIMQRDLVSFFDIIPTKEKRQLKCLVLRRTSNLDKLTSKGSKPYMDVLPGNHFILWNTPFMRLTEAIKDENCLWIGSGKSVPFIDESGINALKNVDMKINGPFNDIVLLNSELKRYDLKLIEEERILEVWIIKKRKE